MLAKWHVVEELTAPPIGNNVTWVILYEEALSKQVIKHREWREGSL